METWTTRHKRTYKHASQFCVYLKISTCPQPLTRVHVGAASSRSSDKPLYVQAGVGVEKVKLKY